MNKILIISLIFAFSFTGFSCSKFVNLGDSSNDKSVTDDLPEELSDNENASGDTGDSGNSGNSGNSGDTGDSGDSGNTGNSGDTTDLNDSEYVSDDEVADETVSDDDASALDGYPFSGDFSNDNCACGKEPEYAPVCCNGLTSAFSACFANCYAINSDNKICYEYAPGVCESLPDQTSDEDIIDDADSNEISDTEISDTDIQSPDVDTEVADADPVINNECGCYPSDTSFYCCYVNGTVFISKCMADCHCKGGYSDCF